MRTMTRKLKARKDLVSICVKVTPEFHSKVRTYAQDKKISISLLVETALSEHIEK